MIKSVRKRTSSPVKTMFMTSEELEELWKTQPRNQDSFLDRPMKSYFECADVEGKPIVWKGIRGNKKAPIMISFLTGEERKELPSPKYQSVGEFLEKECINIG